MNLIERAFSKLYPDKEFVYNSSIKYSGKFKSYNANVRRIGNNIQFKLSSEWKKVDEEIVIGLIQDLFVRLTKEKRKSSNIDLYHTFIKRLHLAIPKTQSNPILEDSFNRVNNRYFQGLVDKPNLRLGNPTTTKLGSYDFHTDTITVSSVFIDHQDVIDYIMYHEMLHKKLKFSHKGLKTMHHTKQFKHMEKKFENSKQLEAKITKIIRSSKIKSLIGFKLF